MDFGIKGRVALVSGGSKGMGREVSRMLAAEGCKVAVVARSPGPIEEIVAELKGKGHAAMGVPADLVTREGVEKAVRAVRDTFGPPDIAICNVQDNIAGDFFDVKDEDFNKFFEIYTMSVIYMARAVIPDMQKKKWGRFVNINSGAAKEPEGMIKHMLANTTRPAAVAFAKTLADEVAKDGITVNTVAPGWIGTDNMYSYLKKKQGVEPGQVDAWLQDAVPARRVGKPEEVASLVAYFCSELAAYVTGEWVVVDGGKHRFAF